MLLRLVYDCYELFTSHLRKNQSVDTREEIFDMSFHGSLRVSASCAELFTDTTELLTDACE